jgi:hypothetical protein
VLLRVLAAVVFPTAVLVQAVCGWLLEQPVQQQLKRNPLVWCLCGLGSYLVLIGQLLCLLLHTQHSIFAQRRVLLKSPCVAATAVMSL